MKKRSLFAAVAMLIVSALVLTSATYAWFATGGPAQIKGLNGNVAQVSAGVFLKTRASGATWVNELTKDDLVLAGGNNHFATTYRMSKDGAAVASTTAGAQEFGEYAPISSANPNGNTNENQTIFAYNLDGIDYNEVTTGVSAMYDMYEFVIGTASEDTTAVVANDSNVEVKLDITGTASAAARVAVYTSTDNGSTWNQVQVAGNNAFFSGATETKLVSGSAQNSWKPIIASLQATKDTTQDYIVTEDDEGTSIGTKLSPNALPVIACEAANTNATFTLNDVHVKGGYTLDGTTYYNTIVRVFVWLEGQDQDCVPVGTTVPGGAINVDWYFRVPGEAWPS